MLKRGNPKYNYTLNPYQFRYGNYVGHGWSDGKEQYSVTNPTVKPVDYLDEQAMYHDMDSANAKTTLDLAQADLKFAYNTIGSSMIGTAAGVGVGAQGLSRIVTGLMEAGYSYATALAYAESMPPPPKTGPPAKKRKSKAIKYEPQDVIMDEAMINQHGYRFTDSKVYKTYSDSPHHYNSFETGMKGGKPTGNVAIRNRATGKVWGIIIPGKDGSDRVVITSPENYGDTDISSEKAAERAAQHIQNTIDGKGELGQEERAAILGAIKVALAGKKKPTGSSVSKDAHDIMSLQRYRQQPRHKRMMAERKVKAGKWGPAFQVYLTCGFLPGHTARREIAATLKKYGVHL